MDAADNASARPPLFERLLPRFLFDEAQPWPLYAVKGWLLILLPSLMLGYAVGQLVEPGSSGLPGMEFNFPRWLLFLGIVIFAPVTETLVMLVPLLLVNKLAGPTAASIASSALWAGAHSLSAPAWGLVAWWPFLVFSAMLLFWRRRGRLWHGVALVMLIHAMQNAVPFTLIAFG